MGIYTRALKKSKIRKVSVEIGLPTEIEIPDSIIIGGETAELDEEDDEEIGTFMIYGNDYGQVRIVGVGPDKIDVIAQNEEGFYEYITCSPSDVIDSINKLLERMSAVE